MKTLFLPLLILYCFTLFGCKKDIELQTSDSKKTNLSDTNAHIQEQVLISEILPDPMDGGVEFIEIYNNTTQIIDLQSLEIASVNSSGKRNRLHRISDRSDYLYPGRYKVLSKDSQIIQDQYSYEDASSFYSMESFPTLTNTQGAVLLFLNETLIDSLFYTNKMHDIFIKNPKGVSLERVDFNKSANLSGNFISAAATNGYATPGYQNSQAVNEDSGSYGFSVQSDKFNPDKNETLEFRIDLPKGGKMANILIYSSSGKRVRKLFSNHRLGTRNIFHWNGRDDYNKPLPAGVYYIYTELYDSVGELTSYKEACLLIR